MATVPVILVAVDGSEQSMHTVRYLGRILSPQHVNLELLHILSEAPESFFDLGEVEGIASYEAEIGEWRRNRGIQIENFMHKAKTTLVDAGFPPESVTTTVKPRKTGIARDIIGQSTQGYAAVVVGRRGFGNLPEFMMGSIAAKLADSIVDLPLAVVGGQPETRKVMVAFDRSQGIQKGLESVGPLLSRSLEEILLCHIVRPLSEPHPARASFFSTRNEGHWLDENSRKIIPAMVNAKQQLSRAGFDQKAFSTSILKEKTSRADGVLGEAESLGYGTIIIGRRGTTTVKTFVMGRVTRKILHMAFGKAIWIV